MTQLEALLLSLLLELPVVLGLAAGLGLLRRISWKRLLLVGCAATLLTHPFAWHGFALLRPYVAPLWARALLIEGGVAMIEGLLYATLGRAGHAPGQVLGWGANAFSYGLGLVIIEQFYR